MLNRWNGETVCIIASGPSLTRADADYARLAAKRVIVINNSYLLCPRADVLYAADEHWYRRYQPQFDGEKWSSRRNAAWCTGPPPEGITLADTKQGQGLAVAEPIYEGSNSSFQAMSLAVIWGARKIVFLGLDLQHGSNGQSHWHGDHTGGLSNPYISALALFRAGFEKVAPDLVTRGVEVINASRATALTCFPRKVITDALP